MPRIYPTRYPNSYPSRVGQLFEGGARDVYLARTFNGVDQFGEMPFALGTPASYEISLNVYLPTPGSTWTVFDSRDGAGDGVAITMSGVAGSIVNLLHDGVTHSTTGTYDGAWHHIRAIWNGTTVQWVIDRGVETTTPAAAGALATGTTANMRLCKRSYGAPPNYFAGSIRNVKIITGGTLQAWYKDGGPTDFSGNGRTMGTMTGTITTTTAPKAN